MGPSFKLIQKTDPRTWYETQQDSFLLGKSEACGMVISDPHISDVQARVTKKNETYFIKNLGPNPILVNGHPTAARLLENGDEISFGQTKFQLQIENRNDEMAKAAAFEAQTMVMTSLSKKNLGPHLVCTNSAGQSKTYPLKTQKAIIGRSSEAHLKLVHPLVSRKHCVIEKRDNAYFIRNISTTNPLFFNDHDIAEKRLYTGDQLKIGTFSLTFVSDRPEDVRVIREKIVTQNKRPLGGLLLATFLVFILGGSLLYFHAYKPWKIKHTLKTVSNQIDAGEYLATHHRLKRLLKADLSPDDTHQAMELLARTVLAITQQKFQNDNLEEAKKYLMAYLAEYGAGKEAEVLWERLDYYRLALGKRLESSSEKQLALRQYAAIREESLYFFEAQKAIRRIWLAYQQPSREEQTLSQLLKEAETHFKAKRYLTPVNQNAYAVYRAILALEPRHKLALSRIEQIKSFYREIGDKYYKEGQWPEALTYFERYYFIDPESPDIYEKISACRQKLAASNTPVEKAERAAAVLDQKSDEKRQEVKRLLEESGTESSWLMQYLFEDRNGEKDSETPW